MGGSQSRHQPAPSPSRRPVAPPVPQPTISEDVEAPLGGAEGLGAPPGKHKRSLASKLLARGKSSKGGRSGGGGGGGDASSTASSLDRLAFGSHGLSHEGGSERRRRGGGGGLAGESIDEESSARSDDEADDATSGASCSCTGAQQADMPTCVEREQQRQETQR